MHAIALAQRGFRLTVADLSAGMIERARANAAAAGVGVRFEVAGFGHLARVFDGHTPRSEGTVGERSPGAGAAFDALLCLGNSLPHVLTPEALEETLADFAACLRPGGLLLIQNRNFDAVLARGQRWMEPQSHREGESEWLFLRFYDFEPGGERLEGRSRKRRGTLAFNLLTLRREAAGAWTQQVAVTRLWPMVQRELAAALDVAGFGEIVWWGDMQGASFDPGGSPNLVVAARCMG